MKYSISLHVFLFIIISFNCNVFIYNIGYMSNEKQTSEVFVGDYYMPGDRAYYDADDYFWFVGRADDVIISSGYVNFYSLE